ncbi:DNA polymerase Y family protein [Edaphobacter paludis]|uniref:DNA polymerase Y family protein n=1 Tax=Edaphobacter paludis TaxID=3035702 RepID=A0AAU7D6K3_9BACT
MTKLTELYACVYAKEFPAQALLRLRPELRNQPCVVMEGEPPLQSVCSLNAKARVSGAVHGMTRVEVETLPAMNMLSRSYKEESAAKAALLDAAGTLSPRVEDHSSETGFVCVIDIAGSEKLFGPANQLARELFKRIRAIGITASIAVSANVHAAKCLARGMSLRFPVMVVPSGEQGAALATLPLTVLDLPKDQSETFASWGIHTLGMLAALPVRELIARMGQHGKRLRQLATGTLPHLFQPVQPAFTLEEKMELDSPVEILGSLLFVAGVMLEQLILRAASRVLALASVTITLSLEGNATHVRTVRPALPTNDRQLWIKLLHLDLEAHPPSAAILALTLSAEPGSTSKVQLGLFSPQLPEPSRLDVTLARIAKIVGEENVGKAVLVDTHHEQEGFRLERFTVPTSAPPSASTVKGCAAMRELRPAESVRVISVEGKLDAILFRQKRYAVIRAYGPWRASGEWWNSNLWGCEQWDIVARAEDGPLLCCCLMRDLMQNQWQIAGLYD